MERRGIIRICRGKFSVGKGSGAADSTSEVDLSGTSVIMYAGVNDTAAGFTWTFKDGNSITLNGINPSYQFNNSGVFPVTLKVSDGAGFYEKDIHVLRE